MKVIGIFIIIFSILPVGQAAAYVASSSNYRLERDSINFAGDRSTSSNYEIEDTVGEVGTGRGTSTNYILNAGYQQSVGYISISVPGDVSLSPTITTLEGGTASGNAIWTVATDNANGYVLYIKSDTSPALKSSSNSFANYTLAGTYPDYSWSVNSTASEFGFTPEGDDVANNYKDNGTNCGAGSSDTVSACWDSIATTDKLIARRTILNHPAGTQTTVKFQAEAGASANQAAGTYSAIITVTASVL